jgi:hypothetical protein
MTIPVRRGEGLDGKHTRYVAVCGGRWSTCRAIPQAVGCRLLCSDSSRLQASARSLCCHRGPQSRSAAAVRESDGREKQRLLNAHSSCAWPAAACAVLVARSQLVGQLQSMHRMAPKLVAPFAEARITAAAFALDTH